MPLLFIILKIPYHTLPLFQIQVCCKMLYDLKLLCSSHSNISVFFISPVPMSVFCYSGSHTSELKQVITITCFYPAVHNMSDYFPIIFCYKKKYKFFSLSDVICQLAFIISVNACRISSRSFFSSFLIII